MIGHWKAHIIALLLATLAAAQAPSNDNEVVCIYPVSEYNFLSRLNYYLLLLFAALMHRSQYLVGGAFIAVMATSGVAAFHAILLAASHNRVAIDLDAWGIWCILSPAGIILGPMMKWTATLRHSPARPIMKIWGVLLGVGIICAFVTLSRTYAFEAPCFSTTTGELLLHPSQYIPGQYTCTYTCFSSTYPLRSKESLTIATKSRVFSSLYNVMIPGMGIAVLVLAFLSIFTSLTQSEHAPAPDGGPTESTFLRLETSAWIDRRDQLNRGFIPTFVRMTTAAGSPPFLIATVVLNELYLKKPGLGPVENLKEVGEWGTWVKTGLVVFAALINYVADKK